MALPRELGRPPNCAVDIKTIAPLSGAVGAPPATEAMRMEEVAQLPERACRAPLAWINQLAKAIPDATSADSGGEESKPHDTTLLEQGRPRAKARHSTTKGPC